MIRVLDLTQSSEWDSIVRSFVEYDVYYLSGYVKGFCAHGDGDPFLMYYEQDGIRAVFVYMRRTTLLPDFFDSITPYGYGGVLFEGVCSNHNLEAFWKLFSSRMKEERIVDCFVRYHPVLRNAGPMKLVSDVSDLGHTIAMDLSSPEVIWDNITSKNRNMIRKAEKNGIVIHHGKDRELLNVFRSIYDSTMKKDHADSYYYFDDIFYDSVFRDLYDNFELFYAVYEGRIIAMSIILYANKQMHYHLSGSLYDYRSLAPSNLMLYKAALWGYEQGYKSFHLGGGIGSAEDNLYRFKAAFNKNSDCQFAVGRQVFCKTEYEKLVEMRKESDPLFDDTIHFFPLYRA